MNQNRAWGVAIIAGLVLAAALIVVPRYAFFEPKGRDACEDIGQEFVGLISSSGRYADPVPEGARCLYLGRPSVTEVKFRFFGGTEAADAFLAWAYRFSCIVFPISLALFLGLRFRGTAAG